MHSDETTDNYDTKRADGRDFQKKMTEVTRLRERGKLLSERRRELALNWTMLHYQGRVWDAGPLAMVFRVLRKARSAL